MSLEHKIHELLAGTRIEARKEIVKLFLEEQSGTGKGKLASKYEYTVEQFDCYKIILKRPAALNKGFDFVVHIVGMTFKGKRRHTNPSHADIVDALLQVKHKLSDVDYNKINIEINNIYNLQNYSFENITSFSFSDFEGKKHAIVIVLLAIKWLFIEQDVTYWNWSGRAMLMNKLIKDGLVKKI